MRQGIALMCRQCRHSETATKTVPGTTKVQQDGSSTERRSADRCGVESCALEAGNMLAPKGDAAEPETSGD